MFLIDTNFAIMIREFVLNKEQFQIEYHSLYDEFLKSVHLIKDNFHRVVYQYACEEAARNKKTGNIDLEKYKIMTECFNTVFNIKIDYSLISLHENIAKPIEESKLPLLKSNGLFKAFSIINYISLLKAFMIKNFDLKSTKKEKVKLFLSFMENEVQVFSPMTQTFAIHYFGSDSNVLKGIKKSKGYIHVIDKLYGAAIDLSIPTIAAQLSEMTTYTEVPLFVSFDRGLTTIFDSLKIEGFGKAPSGESVPMYRQKIFYTSGWNDKEIMELSLYGQELQQNTRRRGPKKEISKLFNLAENLEEELKKQFC